MRIFFSDHLKSKLGLKLPICLSFLIAIAFSTDPLFTANQNIYLLQGIAKAVGPPLANDWLANQTDHLFLFTWLTKVTYLISPKLFYFYHVLLSFILIFSLYIISKKLTGIDVSNSLIIFYFFLFFLATKFFSILNGLAGQYILGSYFQPSAFGVFLAASVAFFIFKKYFVAIFCCLIASYFHPTYILQAAFLTLTYQLILFKSGNIKYALYLGIFALIAISPLVYFLHNDFGNISSKILTKSNEILVYYRIPHHTLFINWYLTNHSLLGLATLTATIIIYRNNHNIILLIVIPLILSIIFFTFANLTNNLTMLLLFGQRASVWLMPLSASLLLIRLVKITRWEHYFNLPIKILSIITILIIFILSILGFNKTIQDYHDKNKNELYSFLASLDYNDGILLSPTDRMNVRLNAKVPIFVDFKSHPYRGDEVIEWHARILLSNKFYNSSSTIEEKILVLGEINAKQKLKYILLDSDEPIKNCIPIYKDNNSIVYDAKKCFRN